MKFFAILFSFLVALASADLQAKYPFSDVLFSNDDGEFYGLYWNFTKATESIYFAVNVSTTGWVGFGLSPNGMMPASDVVIGWVSGGQAYFHDRYAEGRFLPPIDTLSQDWFLVNSEEENGYTVLEFSRNFTTCDPQDLDIMSSTARVVWSYSTTDPTDSSGAGARQHDFKGSRSINLLSGLPTRANFPENENSFNVQVSNVVIPEANTTYWCETVRLSPVLINTTQYIYKFSPVITPNARSYVHHILVSLCPTPLRDEEVGISAPCNNYTSDETITSCLRGISLGGWAVGGEGFVYPEGIGYPIGGSGQEHFVVMEMHYDNPDNDRGIVDSSGMTYFYSSVEPRQIAGILTLGHHVTPIMIIPPKSSNYVIAGICNTNCIESSIPPEGIRIFANFLHTHVVGRGLVIEHYRYNSECNVIEELEPIDQNLNYDFNFQQYTHLPREHIVLPGDILVLKCYYNTTSNDGVTLGGLSTLEEMCLTFPIYYPKPANGNILDYCVSLPDLQGSYIGFYQYLNSFDPDLAMRFANEQTSLGALNDLDWGQNPQHARELQYSVLNSTVGEICVTENNQFNFTGVKLPVSKCPYEAPSKCSDVQPKTCCERVLSHGVAPQIHFTVVIAFLMVSLSLLAI